MVQERGRSAGLGDNLHPHQLRHAFAHEWLSGGGNEGDLMRLPAGARGRCSKATRHRLPRSGRTASGA